MSMRAISVLLAAAFFAVGGSPEPSGARVGGFRVVLGSDLEGGMHGYTIQLDGSRLTRLLPTRRPLAPFAVSRDGRTIAYADERAIYVSRGDGSRLQRVIQTEFSYPALSRDGRMVAYTFGSRGSIAVVRTNSRGRRILRSGGASEIDWSPDSRTLVYTARDDQGRPSLVVQPLRGGRRLIARNGSSARWSPDGRWIAYRGYGLDAVWAVRPDGRSNHRVARGTEFGWSPNSRRLAIVGAQDISVVAIDGRVTRRIHIARFPSLWKVLWAPDGRRLLLERSEPRQLWTVGADGRGMRQVTRYGNNFALGWTRFLPTRRPLPPLPPSVRVLGARTVATATRVGALSADGGRVAFPAAGTAADCGHISVWTPGSRSLARSYTPPGCGWPPSDRVYDVELAGQRVAWATESDCGNTCSNDLESGMLGARSREHLASGGSTNGDTPTDFHVRGHGDLLVFNDRRRLVSVGAGRERCQEGSRLAAVCATLRRVDHATAADSVAGGLIAILENEAVAVVDERGTLVRVFPFGSGEARAARIDGNRLVVGREGAVELYDVSTGAPIAQQAVPTRFRLADADGGTAVLMRNNVVMLLRLQDGRSRTLTPGRGPVLAELEPAGLFYSYATPDGGGRVVFAPRSEAEPAERAG
jgi:WD40-like Beta Propeller Repeat